MATREDAAAPFEVVGKTAIVTGAGSGINLAFAKLLLSKGCNVVFADLSLRPEAQELVDGYSQSTNHSKPRAVFVKTNVVDWDALENMFRVADTEFGGADIVCPGAGVFEPHWSNFWHPPGSGKSKDSPHGIGHYASLDIDLTHPIRTTQIAISRWLHPRYTPESSSDHKKQAKASPSDPKRIVHISSVAGQIAVFSTPLYAAAKHALNGFIRTMANLDAVTGIRVTGVAPGVIRTPLWTEHPEKLKYIDEEQDTWVSPEEVAEAMLECCVGTEIEGQGKLDGGSILEVTKGRRRLVQALNDPGPQGEGRKASKINIATEEVFGWLGEDGWGVPDEEKGMA